MSSLFQSVGSLFSGPPGGTAYPYFQGQGSMTGQQTALTAFDQNQNLLGGLRNLYSSGTPMESTMATDVANATNFNAANEASGYADQNLAAEYGAYTNAINVNNQNIAYNQQQGANTLAALAGGAKALNSGGGTSAT